MHYIHHEKRCSHGFLVESTLCPVCHPPEDHSQEAMCRPGARVHLLRRCVVCGTRRNKVDMVSSDEAHWECKNGCERDFYRPLRKRRYGGSPV